MSKPKLKDQPAFANDGNGPPWDGITYRQWLAGIVAAAMCSDQGYATQRWPSSLAEDAVKAHRRAD